MRTIAVPALLALALAAALPSHAADKASARARALHDRFLVLDTHLDTPLNLGRPGWSIVDDHREEGAFSQVDYPRMVEGGLDGGFWVIYTGQGDRSLESNRRTRDEALGRLLQIREMVAAHPDRFELALTAADARRIKAAGRKVVFLSMENASPLALDPSLLSFFHAQGLRMLGITHIGNNEFGDSSNPREGEGAEWGGLSPAGKALVAEANRLGIVLDQSHSADAVFDDLIELSKVPFVLSHSSADAVYDHPRNIDDERLRRLAAHGGVIQVNALGAYLVDTPANPERRAALRALGDDVKAMGGPTPAVLRKLARKRSEIERRYPVREATFEDYMAHLLHILEVAGPDHVGIGADWDGGGGVEGLSDISQIPRITERLLQAGYTEQQIANIWGGNVLRVMEQAQAYAAKVAAESK
ncbi:dipeptidase [Pseudoxanthomonas suwonensis]|uniref:dipeptidase n=1 Tax=Pseudoxanthomonas suwonensis TaxID=314722 RepID=UPI00138F7C58|nr:dipeptidase [Pseudoxanthomonas suwonensis]KAF1700336.1 peptidase M19 [Pseudoxanthomonas suwonensis]